MRRIILAVALLLAASGLLFAEASSEKKTETAPARAAWVRSIGADGFPVVNPAKVTGDMITAGSSTVYPMSEVAVSEFRAAGYAGNITIDSIGSGAGFERFVKLESDISNASAAMPQDKKDLAKAAGREPIEFLVATDALAIVVHKTNTFAMNLTQAEIKLAFSTATTWDQVRAGFPKEKILRFIPGTDSGTFTYFVEHFYKKDKGPILAASDLQLSEDDNILVRGIEGNPYAIGFFGFAYYVEEKDRLNIVSVDGITPSESTVNARTYPLARPLFLYCAQSIMKAKPQAAAFIAFYLNNAGAFAKKVGYFAAPAESITKSKALWMEAMKGAY